MAGLLRRALYARVGTPSGQRWLEAQIDRRAVSFTAASFLRELFGSRDRLIAAAGDTFTARDIALLHRRSADRVPEELWSDADLPLLDHPEAQINGVGEPDDIVAEDERGLRLLYVALTRTTRHLHVVGVHPVIGEEPRPDGAVSDVAAAPPPVPVPESPRPAVAVPARPGRGGGLSAQIVELAAAELAGQIRENLRPAQWPAVLDRVAELPADSPAAAEFLSP